MSQYVLITGATSGIGMEMALGLAKQHFHVVIVGRSKTKSEAISQKISQASGNKKVSYLVGDLSDMEQTSQVAQNYQAQFPQLDILINNAGALFEKRQTNEDGFELNLATNYLSTAVLTQGLLPLLKQNLNPTRIINTTSSLYRFGIDWSDLNFEKRTYRIFAAYGQSKALLTMYSFELAQQLKKDGISVNAFDPGSVSTGIIKKSGDRRLDFVLKLFRPLIFITPEKSASYGIHHATVSNPSTGKYVERTKEVKLKDFVTNVQDRMRLWEITERWINNRKP